MKIERFAVVAVPLAAVAFLGGCDTTEEWPSPDPVRMERVMGPEGEELGWIRTERVSGTGGTYEILYDADFQVVGYTGPDGDHFSPQGSGLEHTGRHERHRGLSQAFERRAVDITTQDVSSYRMARSGPLSARPAPETHRLGESSGDADE